MSVLLSTGNKSNHSEKVTDITHVYSTNSIEQVMHPNTWELQLSFVLFNNNDISTTNSTSTKLLTLTSKRLVLFDILMFLKEDFYACQSCIYLIKIQYKK